MAKIGRWKSDAARAAYVESYESLKELWPQALKDEELQAINAPTLVIFGAETVVTDVGKARERVAAHIQNSEFEVFPGIGHGVLYQSPHREQVLARVDAFVRQYDVETSAAASGL